jgi:hypothetical protein
VKIKQHEDPINDKAKAATKALVRQGRPPDSITGGLAYAARLLKGGRNDLLHLAEGCEDPKVQAVLTEWNAMSPHGRRKTKIENICEGVGITPGEFLGRVAQHAHDTGLDLSKLILGVSHPRVLAASVKQAMRADGFKDREMLMKSSGFMPTPSGPTINNNVRAQAAVVADPVRGLMPLESEMRATTIAVKGEQ